MVMPYLGNMSVVLKRDILKLVRKFYPSVDVKIVYKRGLRISNMFKFKDCFPLKCKSGIVYSIQCNKCGQSAAYIGKTGGGGGGAHPKKTKKNQKKQKKTKPIYQFWSSDCFFWVFLVFFGFFLVFFGIFGFFFGMTFQP